MADVALREAFNRFDVEGILAEKNLEVKDINGKEVIVGELVVKTAPTSFIKLKTFASRLTKDGQESKTFKALKTIMDEYKSIAMTGNEDEADKVSAFGKIVEGKPFKNQQGEVIVTTSNQLSFISRVTDMTKYSPKAKWQGEVFVQGYQTEMKKVGEDFEETDRKIMNVVVPMYGGKVFPMKLILMDIDDNGCIEFFEENVQRNATVKVYCDLVNTTEKIVQGSTSGGFGKKDPQVFTRTINERVVVGADDAYPEYEDGEESQKAYNPQLITQALATRDEAIEEAKNEAPSAPAPKTSFGGGSRPTSTPMTDDTEIPF